MAVEKSSRTLIVLSKSFLQSEHCDTEFDAAHHKNRVIVVVKGELPPKEQLGPTISKYIATNTYLKDDDPWFWNKLRYALPHRGRKRRRHERGASDRMQLVEKPQQPQSNGTATATGNGDDRGKHNASYIVSNPDLSASMNGGPTMFMDALSPPGSAMRQESYESRAPVEVPIA